MYRDSWFPLNSHAQHAKSLGRLEMSSSVQRLEGNAAASMSPIQYDQP